MLLNSFTFINRFTAKKYNLKTLATFPQIIIDGINIGGYSDLKQKIESGEIEF